MTIIRIKQTSRFLRAYFAFTAISPRPLLDFPDKLTVPQTGVKIASERTILVSNLGEKSVNFNIDATDPFNVDIERGILDANGQMQLTIIFVPTELGTHQGTLQVLLDSDVKLTVEVEGNSVNRDVTLEKDSVVFDKTYMGLTAIKTVKLINHSDDILIFKWKQHASEYGEVRAIMKFKDLFSNVKDLEVLRYNKLKTMDIIDHEGHAKVYDRIYNDEVRELVSGDQFLFKHGIFKILPNVSCS